MNALPLSRIARSGQFDYLCIFWASWRFSLGFVDAHSNTQQLQLVADISYALPVCRDLVVQICICQGRPSCVCSCLTAVQEFASLFYATSLTIPIFFHSIDLVIDFKLLHPVSIGR